MFQPRAKAKRSGSDALSFQFIKKFSHNIASCAGPASSGMATSPSIDANTALNLSVLRRHNPDITHIICTASYTVLYRFSASSQSWEKSGIEGSMFVVSLADSGSQDGTATHEREGLERYAVIILNRRGLQNFSLELMSVGDVDVEEEIIQIRGDKTAHEGAVNFGGHGADEINGDMTDGNDAADGEELSETAYGLWVFSEPGTSTAETRGLCKRVIMDCATRVEVSRQRYEDAQERKAHIHESRNHQSMQWPQQQDHQGFSQHSEGYQQRQQQDFGYPGQGQRPEIREDNFTFSGANTSSTAGPRAGRGSINGRQLNLLELFGRGETADSTGRETSETGTPQALRAAGNQDQANGLLEMLRRGQQGQQHYEHPQQGYGFGQHYGSVR